ncbi:hypothetical protein NXX09_20225 [Bacteroides uniformis]|nr:hypothetical protein [Bacteroides uniformis]
MGIAAMDILCCRITIGDADPSNPMRIQNGVEITEVRVARNQRELQEADRNGQSDIPERVGMPLHDYRERDIGGQGRVEDNDGGDAGRCHHRETQRAASWLTRRHSRSDSASISSWATTAC